MIIKATSSYKDPVSDIKFLENWNKKVQALNGSNYERIDIPTSLGNTVVWGINTSKSDAETIVFFPGARTCAMFWDIDNVLAELKKNYRIYLVDVNGQPSLSDGHSPDIAGNGYGEWATEIFRKLSLKNTIVAGASLGGLICLKLAIVAPELVKKAILVNPAGISPFSLSPKNLYYNLLPMIAPSRKNVAAFLDNAVFYNDTHKVSQTAKELMIDYQMHALTRFSYKADKPAAAISPADLNKIQSKVYLILGDKDILFPYERTIRNAKKDIPSLQEVFVVPGTGHGIETSEKAIKILAEIVQT